MPRTLNESLTDVAYDKIKTKLQEHSFNGYINIRQVARELEMSFTPVREAFLRLKNEGLIQHIEKVGYFANEISMKELIPIFQVRECIEMFVWREAFDMITEEDLQRMEEFHQNERRYYSENNTIEYIRQDIEFHSVVLRRYGNIDLLNLYLNVRERHLITPFKVVNKGSEYAIEEHAEWIRILRMGEKEKALQCIQQHIDNTKKRMQEGFIEIYR